MPDEQPLDIYETKEEVKVSTGPTRKNCMTASPKDSILRKIGNKTPIPISGLMLGLASTGSMFPEYRWFFGFFAFVILTILINKVIFDWNTIRHELKNPAVTGIVCTFPIALAVLSTYIQPYHFAAALAVWIMAMTVHSVLMAYFSALAIVKFDVKRCLPCYFIVYVGFSVNAFIAPLYGQMLLGQVLFWFGLVSFFVLFPPLLYRVIVIKGLTEPLIPTVVIFASPASVVLNGYIKVYGAAGSEWMVWMLFSFSLVFWVGSLALIPRILKMNFYPSYSALTFPLVITGIAMNATYQYFASGGNEVVWLQYLARTSVAIAGVFVLYVLVRYVYNYLAGPLMTAYRLATDFD
jgi:exfoliative toxin A/B